MYIYYVLSTMDYVLCTMCCDPWTMSLFHGLSPMYYILGTLRDPREMESLGIPTTAQGMGIISYNVLCIMCYVPCTMYYVIYYVLCIM